MSDACYFILSDAERSLLASVLQSIDYDPQGGDSYVTELRIASSAALPKRIIDALYGQRSSLSSLPHMLFENLPVDDKVLTAPDPNVFTSETKSGYISENLIMMFASLLGEPYSMEFEGAEIVNNLVPTIETKYEYTGLGSELELDFHVENAALKFLKELDFSPSGLLLTGVRCEPRNPMTRVADARAALSKLSSEDVQLLRRPLYRIKLPYRWRSLSENQQTDAVPLVSGKQSFPEVSAVFYPEMVEPQSVEAEGAFGRLHAAVREVALSFAITPGRLLYVNNRFALHARDNFTSSYDDYGAPLRWVQRVFIAPDLWSHRNLHAIKRRVFALSEIC